MVCERLLARHFYAEIFMQGHAVVHQCTNDLVARYQSVRRFTEQLAAPLSAEDCCVQSMPDVSPTKWHLAHVTWFFETFVLQPFVNNYGVFHPQYNYLFNSYYNAVGERHARVDRGLLSRPPLTDIYQYREYVDEAIIKALPTLPEEAVSRLELGLHHEQQHQELLLMDIKHVLSCNPLSPAYLPAAETPHVGSQPLGWLPVNNGLHEIGYGGDGFCYDNEQPRHRVFLESAELADRLITNGEYLAFINDGGYQKPELWLSDGWANIQQQAQKAPLYWRNDDTGSWREFTLAGAHPLQPNTPVTHLSYFEADAYARWAGARLPTEAEWEVVARAVDVDGALVDDFSGRAPHPRPAFGTQLFGDCWEWTSSSYSAYPGYKPADGALGEYNGKFMNGQYVLRGGCCATSGNHLRSTYRNFFYPNMRWQFSGLRLARDV